MRSLSRTVGAGIVLPALLLLLLPGCCAPPLVMHLGEGRPVGGEPSATPWPGPPAAAGLAPGARVAIVECSIEFVTMRYETPTSRQAVIGGPLTPASALIDLSGVFRTRIDYPRDVRMELPRQVHDVLAHVLAARGMTVFDSDDVAAARAYRQMPREIVGSSSPARQIDPRGSDTGRASQFRVYPAWPLRVLEAPCGDEMSPGDTAVMAELAADGAVRLRLRIGVYQGRLSIDRTSSITVTTLDEVRRAEADRSVVSATRVATRRRFELVAGKAYDADWLRFRRELLGMLSNYFDEGLFGD